MDYRWPLFEMNERHLVASLVGPRAEEIAYLLCSTDRQECFARLADAIEKAGKGGRLGPEGFELRNHYTGEKKMIPPEVFANWLVVCSSDLLDQAAPMFFTGQPVSRVMETIFRVSNFQTHAKSLHYVSNYLHKMPPLFEHLAFMLDSEFTEPTLDALRQFRTIFDMQFESPKQVTLEDGDIIFLKSLVKEHGYLAEPHLSLALGLVAKGLHDEAKEHAQKSVELFKVASFDCCNSCFGQFSFVILLLPSPALPPPSAFGRFCLSVFLPSLSFWPVTLPPPPIIVARCLDSRGTRCQSPIPILDFTMFQNVHLGVGFMFVCTIKSER
jgi:hypothetical protein